MNVGATSDVTASTYSQATYASSSNEKTATVKEDSQAAVYEKSAQSKPATYSVNKMSAKEREALVSQLKADQEARQQSLVNLVQDMMGKQGKAYAVATGDDSIWKFLAKGDFTVDAETKAQAEKDIAEDGYWGVNQTSQRLFDFASALAGDDVDKMKQMQEAMMKGFKQATGAWGKDLPEISQNTIDAANKMFDDYYASKEA